MQKSLLNEGFFLFFFFCNAPRSQKHPGSAKNLSNQYIVLFK